MAPHSEVGPAPALPLKMLATPQMWSASDHALALLVDSLRIGTFPIGQRLPTLQTLSAEMGISHVIVRDAVKVLEDEGIVDVRQGRTGGIYVSGTSGFPECLRRLYPDEGPEMLPALIDALAVFEREISVLAARRADPEGLTRLGTIVTAMEAALDDGDAFVELTVRFHLHLAILGGNAVLMHYLRDVLNRIAVTGLRHSDAVMDRQERGATYLVYRDLLAALLDRSEDAIHLVLDRHISGLTATFEKVHWTRASGSDA